LYARRRSVSKEAATTNRPFIGPSFIRRLLVGAATAIIVSLLLLMGTQQEAWAQSAEAPQAYCGPWEVEPRDTSRVETSTESSGEVDWQYLPETQYWNYRWCHSPEVSGGWYKDYAGYSLTTPDATLTITPSTDSVVVGEPVTFRITQTNDEPDTYLNLVSINFVFFYYSTPYEFVSASSSQGQCTYLPRANPKGTVACELGTLPPGASVEMNIVVVPQEPGSLAGNAHSSFGVIGRAPYRLTPSTEVNVTVEPA
jgi:hypothetical protein